MFFVDIVINDADQHRSIRQLAYRQGYLARLRVCQVNYT
jgi:hypothetical protein